MALPNEELLTLQGVAERLKKSKKYVFVKLRLRQFKRVIIEKMPNSGGRWTAHYYFDKSSWPFNNRKENVVTDPPGKDYYYLLDPDDEKNERWIEDAETIYIPLTAVEAFEEKHLASPSSPTRGKILSTRLRAANNAYEEFYVLNKIELQKGGHSKQILEWLTRRYPKLTSRERHSVAEVVNLDPRRGRK